MWNFAYVGRLGASWSRKKKVKSHIKLSNEGLRAMEVKIKV